MGFGRFLGTVVIAGATVAVFDTVNRIEGKIDRLQESVDEISMNNVNDLDDLADIKYSVKEINDKLRVRVIK